MLEEDLLEHKVIVSALQNEGFLHHNVEMKEFGFLLFPAKKVHSIVIDLW